MKRSSRRTETGVLGSLYRCESCGGSVESVHVQVHGEMMPVAAVLLGSFLALYLVGLLFIAVGSWLWCRKKPILLCQDCGHSQEVPADTGRITLRKAV